MARILALILSTCCLWGCTSKLAVNNSTTIGTNANGLAVGQYSDSRSGEIQGPTSMWMGGGGGGGVHGFGMGVLKAGYSTGKVEAEGNPLNFARAVAMINYSRRLEKISADDPSGTRNFTFTDSPVRKSTYQPFGHQSE